MQTNFVFVFILTWFILIFAKMGGINHKIWHFGFKIMVSKSDINLSIKIIKKIFCLYGFIHKPCGHGSAGGWGFTIMPILLQKPYLVKWSTKGDERRGSITVHMVYGWLLLKTLRPELTKNGLAWLFHEEIIFKNNNVFTKNGNFSFLGDFTKKVVLLGLGHSNE